MPVIPYQFGDLTDEDAIDDEMILALAGDDPARYREYSEDWLLSEVWRVMWMIQARHYYDELRREYG